jgi:hypothetical protein
LELLCVLQISPELFFFEIDVERKAFYFKHQLAN